MLPVGSFLVWKCPGGEPIFGQTESLCPIISFLNLFFVVINLIFFLFILGRDDKYLFVVLFYSFLLFFGLLVQLSVQDFEDVTGFNK